MIKYQNSNVRNVINKLKSLKFFVLNFKRLSYTETSFGAQISIHCRVKASGLIARQSGPVSWNENGERERRVLEDVVKARHKRFILPERWPCRPSIRSLWAVLSLSLSHSFFSPFSLFLSLSTKNPLASTLHRPFPFSTLTVSPSVSRWAWWKRVEEAPRWDNQATGVAR